MGYDPIDTLHWMIDGASADLATDTVNDSNGRAKKKTKARMAADQVRFETLCEVLWNIEGRPVEFTEFTGARQGAAASRTDSLTVGAPPPAV